MASLQEMKKYLTYDFSSCDEKSYHTFETKYINFIKVMCDDWDWTFVKANRNFYEFSAVIQKERGQYVYIAISDVRFFKNSWYHNILIRTMKNDHDWVGGINHYSELPMLYKSIMRLK